METIVRIPMKSFVKDNGITAINPVVRTNENGYPFITVMKGNEAENLYFGKKTASGLAQGQVLGKAEFSTMSAVETENAEGEKRIKLSLTSYVDAESLFE